MTIELSLQVPATPADAFSTAFALAFVAFLTALVLAATGLDSVLVSPPALAAYGIGVVAAAVALRSSV